MPSKVLAANAVAFGVTQDVFTAPQNKSVYITQLIVDSTMEIVDDITVTLQDSFTADVTNGVAAPAAVTPARVKLSAIKNNRSTLPDNINNIKMLNTAQIVCSVAAANCDITVVWE